MARVLEWGGEASDERRLRAASTQEKIRTNGRDAGDPHAVAVKKPVPAGLPCTAGVRFVYLRRTASPATR